MQLTHAQKQHLYAEGYVKVPGVVPKVMVDADRKWETMSDAWLEWEGMCEIVAAHRGQR